jgi:hypothetical protein
MGGSVAGRVHANRSQRVQAQPSQFANFVQFVENGEMRSAQFNDISTTGMRLISRKPTRAQPGDIIEVEFSLPGSDRLFKKQARVVRRLSEFIFAVRFTDADTGAMGEVEEAIRQHMDHASRAPFARRVQRVRQWFHDHRQGLWISLVGSFLIGAAGAWIYVNSDAYQGRELSSWAKPMPKEVFLDYVNKFKK